MWQTLKRITDYFIPANFNGDDDEKRKMVFLIWLGIVVGINYAFSLGMISFIVPLDSFQSGMGAFGVFANLSGPFLLRRTGSRFWVAQWLLLGNITCFITLLFVMGGCNHQCGGVDVFISTVCTYYARLEAIVSVGSHKHRHSVYLCHTGVYPPYYAA